MRFASKCLGYKEPRYVNLKKFNTGKYTPLARRMIDPYVPYFNFRAIFDSKKTMKILNGLGYEYPEINDDYLGRLFEYCMKKGYVKRTTKKNTR